MSLVRTLGKIAIGVMVAKGVGKMIKGSGGGGLGGLLRGPTGEGSHTDTRSMGELLGGKKQSGSLGGMLDSLGDSKQDNGLGDLFNQAINGETAKSKPTVDQEMQAKVLIRAMLSAANADGQIDAEEQAKLTKQLGDISAEDAEFVRRELNSPMDVTRVINSVPRGMEQQVYLMSLLAINLDSKEEAVYLDKLAKGLNISHQVSNQIHTELGAPTLYS